MLLSVRVHSRAKQNTVEVRDGRVVVRVAAPPTNGRANTAVCDLLADTLGVPKRHVSVQRGASSRDKVVSIQGMDEREVKRCLGL